MEKDEVTIAIEIRGVKTKKLLEASKEKEIVIRGPYWNGVFGLDNLDKLREDNVLVLARGIGLAPMMPVLKRLKERENYIDLFIDTAPFKDNFAKEYLDKYSIEAKETNLLGKGVLSEEGKFIILNSIKDKNIKHIHLAGADILTYSVIEFLDSIGNDTITLSCCNNFKMCCGEGICGACTARYAGHKVKRFCKTQTEPRNIFEGRRLI